MKIIKTASYSKAESELTKYLHRPAHESMYPSTPSSKIDPFTGQPVVEDEKGYRLDPVTKEVLPHQDAETWKSQSGGGNALKMIKERTMRKLKEDPNFTAEDIPYSMQTDNDVLDLMEKLYGLQSSGGITSTPKLISFRKMLQENKVKRDSQDQASEREGLSDKPLNVNTLGPGKGNLKDKQRVERGKAKGEQFGFGQTNENYGPRGRGR